VSLGIARKEARVLLQQHDSLKRRSVRTLPGTWSQRTTMQSSSQHRNARSFECSEYKCTKCKGAMSPKGHNRNDCPETPDTICTLCEDTGHDEERCPTRPCPSCNCRTHKLPTHFECPEPICTARSEKGSESHELPQQSLCNMRNDCPLVNCVDVGIDWLNSLTYFEDVSLPQRNLRPRL
jgi:hypothetical protein